jgi:hypothetical protein
LKRKTVHCNNKKTYTNNNNNKQTNTVTKQKTKNTHAKQKTSTQKISPPNKYDIIQGYIQL